MARSTYVYIVMKWGFPIAPFTVKHEMIGWLRRAVETAPDRDEFISTLQVYRMYDGGPTAYADPELIPGQMSLKDMRDWATKYDVRELLEA